jgi:hypothetical protein
MESRKKILLLLEICGRTDSEITRTLNKATRDGHDARPDSAGAAAAALGAGGDARATDDVFVPDRIKRLMEQHAKVRYGMMGIVMKLLPRWLKLPNPHHFNNSLLRAKYIFYVI